MDTETVWKKGRGRTHKEYINEVKILVGDEYTVLGEYKDSKTPIFMRHNYHIDEDGNKIKCGYEWEVKPTNFINRGSRCPKCGKYKNIGKKNTEIIKQEVEDKFGDEYTVLGEYKDSKTPIEIRHNVCGKINLVVPSKIKNRRSCLCKDCSIKKRALDQKYDTELFKKKIYDLVGDEYTVLGEYVAYNTNPVRMRHNYHIDEDGNKIECGYEYDILPCSFIGGSRCAKCAHDKLRTYKNEEEYKEAVYDLVGDEYTVLGGYTKLLASVKMRHNYHIDEDGNKIECGYEWSPQASWFLRGTRCPKCLNAISITTDIFKERVKGILGDEYTVLGEYIDKSTPIKIRHELCRNEYDYVPSTIMYNKNFTGCPYCSGSITLTPKNTKEFKIQLYDLVGDEYTVLGEYVNSKEPILIKHNYYIDEDGNTIECGYEYKVSPNNFISKGTRCPKCARKTSNGEIEITKYIESLGIKVTRSNRTLLHSKNGKNSKKEIDIYLKSYNIGIEFDGLWWHSEQFREKDYHLDKTKLAEKNDIRLIHIFEDEWMYKQKIVKDKLSNLFGISKYTVYARNCYIEEISSRDKDFFLEENHIQGKDKSNIKLGMFIDTEKGKELIAVMTFCKPRRALGLKHDSAYDYELSRYASKSYHSVVGGFSKMLKYFERNYEWNKIITYADRRWSNGNVYLKNGFIHLRNSKPNYWYIKKENKKIRYHRYSFRKSVLKEKFPDIYDDNLTEKEIMRRAGYYRVYDCGNMVFEYTKLEIK